MCDLCDCVTTPLINSGSCFW